MDHFLMESLAPVGAYSAPEAGPFEDDDPGSFDN